MRSLAETMTTNGHPISHSVISQIENGSRRIDVDELVVIATYIDASPTALLTPRSETPDAIVGDSVHEKASAREVVARNFRRMPDTPEWVGDAIDVYSGVKWKYLYDSLSTLDKLRDVFGTDDIEMLLTIATGLVTKEKQDHDKDLQANGDD